jgi:catechol 2,3-dioxygenase-like lactoylglutathione lyase family enzyme
MRIVGLDHINITVPSALLETVRDFYIEVLGLVAGERPPFSRKGFWLYADSRHVVHLTTSSKSDPMANVDQPVEEVAQSFLDHIAFAGEGRLELIERLQRLQVPHTVMEVSSIGQTQIFVDDPSGLKVEINFSD